MKISVCFIVRNEEENLSKALSSIPSDYEIVVVDTGSTDLSVEIARSMGAKVFHFQWGDDFSEARNYSIRQASGQYILIMDADESLREDFDYKVKKHIKKFPRSASSIIIENIDEQEKTRHQMVRFFPNTGTFYFHGIVHEQLYEDEKLASFVRSDMVIQHYGYQKEIYNKKGKYERYIRLYNKVIQDEPQNGYMYYQLGKLHYSQQKYDQAYEAFMKSLELEQYDKPYFPPMIVQLGYTLRELGRHNEALELLQTVSPHYSNYPDLFFLIGLLYMEAGRFELMKRYFEACLSMGETDQFSTVVGTGSFRAAHNLGVYYEVSGNKEEALRYYNMAIEYGYQPSISRKEYLIKIN